MHECASAESWPAAVSRAWRLQGQIDRALAWSDSQHGVRPASHRGLTLNSAQKGAKASRLNCRSAAVPHESDGARELRMALSGCVNRSSEPAASRKRSFRLPQTHRAKRRGQPANPERRRYLRADSFSGSQHKLPLRLLRRSYKLPHRSNAPWRLTCLTRLHQLRGLGDAKLLKSLGRSFK